jgi:hypothetical protein
MNKFGIHILRIMSSWHESIQKIYDLYEKSVFGTDKKNVFFLLKNSI